MSHRRPTAPNVHPASRGVHPRGPEPCHPEVPRGVRPAFRPTAYSLQPPASPSRGLTLIEMLVALAVTLVMMAAVVNLFANISGSIRNRRAMIEVGGQIRQVRQRLALDLEGATCNGKTWQRPEENRGYIEIIEGQYSDAFPSMLVDGLPATPTINVDEIDYAISPVPSGGDVMTDLTLSTPPLTARQPQPGDVTNGRALGDWDDILALTVRSEAEPFKAQVDGTMVESTLAEVLWFAIEAVDDSGTPNVDESNGAAGMRTIYRRVLLIAPSLGPWPSGSPPENVSVRFDPVATQWVANTLGDLTKRENRVERRVDSSATPPQEPFPFPISGMGSSTSTERIVLSNALAFDIRVFDPGAPLYEAAGTVVQPGDPGWIAEAVKTTPPPVIAGYGAYCDLGWAWNPATAALVYNPALPMPTGIPAPVFNTLRQVGWHPMLTNAPAALRGYPCVYDTWSFHYENDGMGQENELVRTDTSGVYRSANPMPQFNPWQLNTLDQGTNGLDDDNLNGVDDVGERETSPPYDTPLRGVKVILRIYETDARQIRETSVTHSFAE
jgi:prepilin-type N-terminal cleavage/methylation domain-containing protein